MRYTHSPKDAGTGVSLRRFGQSGSIFLFHFGALLTAISANGQTPLPTPKELLLTDPPRLPNGWKSRDPTPYPRSRRHGFSPPCHRKERLPSSTARLDASLRAWVRFFERWPRHMYNIKVVDIRYARVGVYERVAVLISKPALMLLEAEDLQALVAHEIAHEYVSGDYERATELEDHRRLKDLELLCDAIAIVTLQGLRMNPWRLISAVEKIDRYNQELSGSRVNRTNYPTLAERRAFARDVTKWAAASPNRSSQ